MKKQPTSLPDDVIELKNIISEQQVLINALTEQVRLLKHHRFASSSEKASFDQLLLFNEAELEIRLADENTELPTEVAAHTRQRGHRQGLSKDLPRVDVIHESKSYMFVRQGGPPDKRMILLIIHPPKRNRWLIAC